MSSSSDESASCNSSDDVDNKRAASSRRRRDDDEDMDLELDEQAMKDLMDSGTNDDGDSSGSPSDDASDDAPLDYDYEYSPDGLLLGRKPLSSDQIQRIRTIESAATNVARVIQKYANAQLPSLDPNDANEGNGWEIPRDSAWADTSLAMVEIVGVREELIKAWGDGDDEGPDETGAGDEKRRNYEWWEPILSKERTPGSARGTKDGTIDKTNDDEPLSEEELNQFQSVHMEWATNAFSEELEALRKGQLDQYTSARRQSKKGARAGTSATGESNVAVELDPTQYSFVVAASAGNKAGDGSDEAAAAAAREIDVQVLGEMLNSGGSFLSDEEKGMMLRARQRALAGGYARDTDASLETLHERRKREIGLAVE